MKIPRDIPVMTLPGATLFPRAQLRLHIFEPRYRRMLHDVLHSHRMFAIAMQKPGSTRTAPLPIAGLGLVHVSVQHNDGTSHLVLRGLTRIELGPAVQNRPYRLQRYRILETPDCDNVRGDALLAKVRELLGELIALGMAMPKSWILPPSGAVYSHTACMPRDLLNFLSSTTDLSQAADLVACAILQSPNDRQAILETVSVETRLARLIPLLLNEIQFKRNTTRHE